MADDEQAKCAAPFRRRVSDWVGLDMLVERLTPETASKVAGWPPLPGAGTGVLYNKDYFDALFEGHLDDVSLITTIKYQVVNGVPGFGFEKPTWPVFVKWLHRMCHARHVQFLIGYGLDHRDTAKLDAFRGLLYAGAKPFDAAGFANQMVAYIQSKIGDSWDGISFDIEVPITKQQLGSFGSTLPEQLTKLQDRFRAMYREVARAIGPDRILAYAPAGAVSFDPNKPFTYHNNFADTLDPLTRPFAAAPPKGGKAFTGEPFHYVQTCDARFEANNIICRPMIYDGITNDAKDEQYNWYWEMLRVAIDEAKARSKVANFKPGQLPQYQVGVKLSPGAGQPNTHMTSSEVRLMAKDMIFNSTAGISHFAGTHATWAGTDLALNPGAPKSCGPLLQIPLPKPWTTQKTNDLLPL